MKAPISDNPIIRHTPSGVKARKAEALPNGLAATHEEE
jgi:hypothetical protein